VQLYHFRCESGVRCGRQTGPPLPQDLDPFMGARSDLAAGNCNSFQLLNRHGFLPLGCWFQLSDEMEPKTLWDRVLVFLCTRRH